MVVDKNLADKVFGVLSGKIVENHLGIFYFKSSGQNMDHTGYPIWKNLHRKDGPAIQWEDGAVDLERNSGPTYITITGRQCFYKNGKRIKKPK